MSEPQAVSISPGDWIGNDGSWSAFVVQVGTEHIKLQLLPATSSNTFWVVHPLGCRETHPDGCDQRRGGIFDSSQSSSFSSIRADTGELYLELPFYAERSLGFNASAEVGQDSICFGSNLACDGGKLERQIVAAYAEDFPWTGAIGLNGRSSQIVATGDPDPSPLQSMKSAGAIASTYYAYAAGAKHMEQPGSLTFGGYDRQRGSPSDGIEVLLNQADSYRDLIVKLRTARIGTGSALTTVDIGVDILVDSLIPEIYLPEAACDAIAEAYGLEWNQTVGYYLVNDTQHDRLLDQNLSMNLTIAAADSSDPLDIELPYASFDHMLSFPLANITDGTTQYRYFPMKRASGTDQYFLGRTFLQHAYLMVNYDTNKFWVSPARTPDSAGAFDLVMINEDGSEAGGSSGLSAGAIAGIVIGGVAVLAIIAGLLFWRWRHRRKINKLRSELTSRVSHAASMGGTTIDGGPEIEFFKPPPSDEDVKPELEATTTVRGPIVPSRHELSAASVRRESQHSGLSQSALSRNTISPIDRRMHIHHRSMSGGSSYDQPSPGDSPIPGHAQFSPTSSHPSPPMSELQHHSGGLWYFEMPADSRTGQRFTVTSETSNVETGGLLSASDAVEGSRTPVERTPAESTTVEEPRRQTTTTAGEASGEGSTTEIIPDFNPRPSNDRTAPAS